MGDENFKLRDELPDPLKKQMKTLMDNFLIVFVKRAGGKVTIPVEEVDKANDLLVMNIVNGEFILTTKARN